MFLLITAVFISNVVVESTCWGEKDAEETIELSEKGDFDEKKEKEEQSKDEKETFFQELVSFSHTIEHKSPILRIMNYSVLSVYNEVFTPPPELS